MVERDYMERALFHAARGAGRTSPNPLVGAVVVSADGVVVGPGFQQRAGEAHAEVHALAEAGSRARGATLYCTLEPCCHQGRTGPCVSRIVDAGVARVVAAVEDPNPAVRGRGFAFLRERGVSVDDFIASAAFHQLPFPNVLVQLSARVLSDRETGAPAPLARQDPSRSGLDRVTAQMPRLPAAAGVGHGLFPPPQERHWTGDRRDGHRA